MPRIYFKCKDASFGTVEREERNFTSGKNIIHDLLRKSKPLQEQQDIEEQERLEPEKNYSDRIFP